MTEAGWTREKPTVAGWYWFRRGKQQAHTIVQVWGNTCGWRVLEMGRQYAVVIGEYEGGEFLGPITPDSYQQGRVEGLEEAARRADKIGNQSSSSHVRSVVGLIVMDLYEQLAQAAQDEKGVGDDSVQ